MATMDPLWLEPGCLLLERFEIECAAGSGGMAAVYRARDRDRGGIVAIKLLHGVAAKAGHAERFEREAQILSELNHPGIVSYVAQGQTPAGQRFLAMEWLEGEDLGRRIARGPLSVRDSAKLLTHAAAALSVAHQRGVVHRDIKPSNLFLRQGHLDHVVLIDFGIARRVHDVTAQSQTGDVLGTPEYVAPEQARGETEIGPSADIFSLGCILYECLAGKPPFAGEHPLVILGRILFGEPPALAEVREDVPLPLLGLLSRMLAKDPAARPHDAAALHGELVALASMFATMHSTPRGGIVQERGLTTTEQRLFSVVLATRLEVPEATSGAVAAADELRATLTSLGARLERLPDGAMLATVAGTSSAQDQATLAARCALLVQNQYPEAQIAVATGRGLMQPGRDAQLGEAIERAAAQVGRGRGENSSAVGKIWLDEVTAGLLSVQFPQSVTPDGILLHHEIEYSDGTRLLLGKPTPFVGRDPELLMLEALLRSCVTESRAQGVLVVAPPGMGKSRLRHEFLKRAQAQGIPALVLQGRASPLSAGSPYSALAHALRGWCGTQRGEALSTQQAKLQNRLTEYVPTSELARVSEFLGELCGIPFPDEHSVPLLAARRDPKLMHDQLRQAFIDFVRSVCTKLPLLLVVDDLHWEGALSINLLGDALAELAELPFMVLALARPELKELFPSLWSGGAQELQLGGLGRRAAERLCRQILGDDLAPAVLARIIERATGNALYLEELIRATVESSEADRPGTVMAMLQARILRLDVAARQALRAASILGENFWRGGLQALLGTESASASFDSLLKRLTAAEIIEPRQESRFAGEQEYRFRHALMRDAAYGLLTEEDQRLGHRLAARYLDHVGETEAVVIAEHYVQGDLAEQAVMYFERAAQQSIDRYDSEVAMALVERGIACGAKGQELGTLYSLKLRSLSQSHRWHDSPQVSRDALALLSPGSLPWCRAMMESCLLSVVDKVEHLIELGQRIVQAQPEPDATIEYIPAIAHFIFYLSTFGIRPLAHRCLERLLDVAAPHMETDPVIRSWCLQAHSYFLRFLGADPWKVYLLNQGSVAAYELTRDLRFLAFKLGEYGSSVMEMGSWEDAERPLRRAVSLAQGLAEPFPLVHAQSALLINLVRSSEPRNCEEAHRLACELIPKLGSNVLYEGALRTMWGQNWALCGDLDAAENELRRAKSLLQTIPAQQFVAIAYLIPVLLKRGQAAGSLALAHEGLKLLESFGEFGDYLVRFLVAAAEAHQAVGATEVAMTLLRKAKQQIELRASLIPGPEWRARFLSLPENVRAAELGRLWPEPGLR